MTTLVIEPFGGLAGDMLLAALLDLRDPRVDLDGLRALARALVGDEAKLTLEETRRRGLRAKRLDVRTPETDTVPHRGLAELVRRLDTACDGGALPQAARDRAVRALERLAIAEAEVHDIPVERVHFHEVGAVDTLIDVGGAAWAIEGLGVTRVLATPPLVGSGTVDCAHGTLPVPAPATALLLRGVPHRLGGGGERLTPTGAALLAELAEGFEVADLGAGAKVGYGAGSRDPDEGPANLVRVVLAQAPGSPGGAPARARGEAWLLEVTLDDTTGEELGFVLEELYAAGALEAWTHPVAMKKGRPGVVLSALCRAVRRDELERVVFAHTPTLGVRWAPRERTECERELLSVPFEGRAVRVKRRLRPGAAATAPEDLSPEHDDLAALARATGKPLRALEREVVRLALERLQAGGER